MEDASGTDSPRGRLLDAIPAFIARSDLYFDDKKRRRRRGEPEPTPEDTQKDPELLFLRGIGQISVAMAALDYRGLRPQVYSMLEGIVLEDEARRAAGSPVTATHNVILLGMDGIRSREAVVDGLLGMHFDAELPDPARDAAADLLGVLGIELPRLE